MATVVIYNNDIQGALRALKKEQQKEGVFRIVKAKKNFKNARVLSKERMDEIVRRKIKDKHEKKANNAYSGISEQKPKPFVFKLEGYIVKVYDNGKVAVYTQKNKKIREMMLNNVEFDNIKEFLEKSIKEEKQAVKVENDEA